MNRPAAPGSRGKPRGYALPTQVCAWSRTRILFTTIVAQPCGLEGCRGCLEWVEPDFVTLKPPLGGRLVGW